MSRVPFGHPTLLQPSNVKVHTIVYFVLSQSNVLQHTHRLRVEHGLCDPLPCGA